MKIFDFLWDRFSKILKIASHRPLFESGLRFRDCFPAIPEIVNSRLNAVNSMIFWIAKRFKKSSKCRFNRHFGKILPLAKFYVMAFLSRFLTSSLPDSSTIWKFCDGFFSSRCAIFTIFPSIFDAVDAGFWRVFDFDGHPATPKGLRNGRIFRILKFQIFENFRMPLVGV